MISLSTLETEKPFISLSQRIANESHFFSNLGQSEALRISTSERKKCPEWIEKAREAGKTDSISTSVPDQPQPDQPQLSFSECLGQMSFTSRVFKVLEIFSTLPRGLALTRREAFPSPLPRYPLSPHPNPSLAANWLLSLSCFRSGSQEIGSKKEICEQEMC